MTRAEAENGTMQNDEVVITVRNHKTSSTHGPAVIVLDSLTERAFAFYLIAVRDTIATSSEDTDIALVTESGRPLNNYSDLLRSVCRRYNLRQLPTLTATRKAGATAAVEEGGSRASMEKLGQHMSHLTSTSEKHYRIRKRKETALEAHKMIQDLTAEGMLNPCFLKHF